MTRKEAIKELELIAKVTIRNARREAMEMAIKVLQTEVVQCKDCRYQIHCYQTVSHNKIHDGFKEYWSEPIDFCSKGERKKP